MQASLAGGLIGALVLVAGLVGLLDLEGLTGLALGVPLSVVHLLVGLALLVAAATVPRRRPVIAVAAVLYGAFALLGLNVGAVSAWPGLFGRDGRSLALLLAALLALAAMVSRESEEEMAGPNRKSARRRGRAPDPGAIPPIQPEAARARPTPWQGEKAPALFTSLEAPPSPDEALAMLAAGVRYFDFDLGQSPKQGTTRAAISAIKNGGGKITAYHVGGGGGDAWGGAAAGEEEIDLTDPDILEVFKRSVADLVLGGADYIHIDNMHRLTSAEDVEIVVDAAKSVGVGVIDKNAPELWADLLDRRPDLKPPYAILENAVQQRYQAPAIKRLAQTHGVPVYIVDFERNLDGSKGPTPAQARAFADKNPWIKGIFLMPNETAFEGRSALYIAPSVDDGAIVA